MKVIHLSLEQAKLFATMASNKLAIDGITHRWPKHDEFTEQHDMLLNYIDEFCLTFGYMYHPEENRFTKPC
jgi:hypothetical protein